MFKPPQNNDKYIWTNHVKEKMAYYRISESLVKRIVRFPKRQEVGVALRTIAVMQNTGNSKKPQEVWVMYQEIQKSKIPDRAGKNQNNNVKNIQILALTKKRIISAWRYPGVSPIGKPIPIPDDILQELEHLVD